MQYPHLVPLRICDWLRLDVGGGASDVRMARPLGPRVGMERRLDEESVDK